MNFLLVKTITMLAKVVYTLINKKRFMRKHLINLRFFMELKELEV